MDYPSDSAVQLHNGKFTDGDPQAGVPPSKDRAVEQNAVFDELINLIQGAGIAENENQLDQVLQAVRNIAADGDNDLQSQIDSEESARQSADNNLQSQIDAEESARQSEDNDLQNQINGKASSSHTHSISQVTNLQSELNGKASSSHTHSLSSNSITGTLPISKGGTGGTTINAAQTNLGIRAGVVTSSADGEQTFNFNSAFPNACVAVVTNRMTAGAGNGIPAVSWTASSFTLNRVGSIDGSHDVSYIAIGY